MAFTLPRTIAPGIRENAAHVQQNDEAVRDVINQAHATWEVLYSTVTELDNSPATIVPVVFATANTTAAIAQTTGHSILPLHILTDYKVADFTTQLRLRVSLAIGDVNPVMPNFKVSLNPITSASDAVVPGTEVASVSMSVSGVGLAASSRVGTPINAEALADGVYGLTYTPGAAMPTDGVILMSAAIDLRYV